MSVSQIAGHLGLSRSEIKKIVKKLRRGTLVWAVGDMKAVETIIAASWGDHTR